MKTKLLRTAAMGIIMLAASLGIKAQALACPINIDNLTPCDIVITITFEEMNPSCVSCAGGPISIAVPAGSTQQITCPDIASTCANPVCGASLTYGGPGTLIPTPLVWNPGGANGKITPGCLSTGLFLDWSANGDHIVVHP